MKIKLVSYGHKFYEEIGQAPPYHDFLFSLRDLKNPFWVPELKDFNGTDEKIIEFFEKDERTNQRVQDIKNLLTNFVEDFIENSYRNQQASLTFAFKCTGGKHRSVYFAQALYDYLNQKFNKSLEVEIEHVDLYRYLPTGQH